ncbi:MAG: putative two-component histidine kinase [Acidimicrobiaceae bacterium]|nr:MAG: putative two-component histidine kinase [Acidimicrobiaceae bacterium]
MSETLLDEPAPSRLQRTLSALAAFKLPRLGLRTRILLMFVLGALLLAAFLAGAAYSFTRSSLVTQRDNSAVAAATSNAGEVSRALQSDPVDANRAIERLSERGVADVVILYRGNWEVGSRLYLPEQIPVALQQRVIQDATAARMTIVIDGRPVIVLGIPLVDEGASYFEFVDLGDINTTLDSVALSLFFGGLITTMFGGVLGWFAAIRAVRPLGEAAQAARLIAGGRLDTRLAPTDDHDLQLLATSFNEMAAALQAKVERDARFASDVSHELRSPLMTLAASVEVMQARRPDMPERAQTALDLLVSDVSRFQGLVEDLLEISRFDAGAIRLNREDLLVAEFVRQAIAVSSMPGTILTVTERGERMVMQGDRRRLARVVANLVDNARLHGGGAPEVTVSEAENEGDPIGHVWITVEDHGPGVPAEERELVFERFARGAVAGRRSSSDGAGLGLALVDEHIRLHGGRVWVDDRRDGQPGARFVLELPAEEVGV